LDFFVIVHSDLTFGYRLIDAVKNYIVQVLLCLFPSNEGSWA